MKFCSTLLKIMIPANKNTSMQMRLYIKCIRLKLPDPRNAYRKVSTIGLMGFALTIYRYFDGTEFEGYITGVAYINKPTPNPMNIARSLYFVVKLLMIMPSPKANPAININRTGNIPIVAFQ